MKQHQLIAIVSGRKPLVQKTITDLYQKLGAEASFNGLHRVYQPVNEEGEQLPPESKRTINSVQEMIDGFKDSLAPMIDLVASQDETNRDALAQLRAEQGVGVLVIENLPVTTLLYLEKQLTDVRTFISKLPVLPPTRSWTWDASNERYVAEPEMTTRTKKTLRNHVKAPATEHHPAQVDVYTEDVVEGHWTKVDFSTAIPASRKKEMTERVNALIESVKSAREKANEIEVSQRQIGQDLLDYVFGG